MRFLFDCAPGQFVFPFDFFLGNVVIHFLKKLSREVSSIIHPTKIRFELCKSHRLSRTPPRFQARVVKVGVQHDHCKSNYQRARSISEFPRVMFAVRSTEDIKQTVDLLGFTG